MITIKSLNEGILYTCMLVRGFILKDTQEMLKLQWMLLVWCQYDLQQVSVYFSREPHESHGKKLVSWTACPGCCVAALICFNGLRHAANTDTMETRVSSRHMSQIHITHSRRKTPTKLLFFSTCSNHKSQKTLEIPGSSRLFSVWMEHSL